MYRVVTLTFFVTLGLIVGCSSQGSKVAANAGVLDVAPVPAVTPSATPAALPTPEPVFAASPAPALDAQPVTFAAPTPPAVQQAVNLNPAAAASAAAPTGGKTYTVKKGDTLFSISKAQLGTGRDWKKIVTANPGLSPQKLRAGQQITMP